MMKTTKKVTKKKGAPSTISAARKKMGMGGMHMMPDGSMMEDSMMKKGGKVTKMKGGGMLKSVNPTSNPGLSKLPTEVRNKMGYKKKGGKVGTSKKK